MAAARVLIAGAEGAAAPTAAPFGLSMFDAVKQSADLLRNVSTPPAAPVAVAVAATSNDDFDVDDDNMDEQDEQDEQAEQVPSHFDRMLVTMEERWSTDGCNGCSKGTASVVVGPARDSDPHAAAAPTCGNNNAANRGSCYTLPMARAANDPSVLSTACPTVTLAETNWYETNQPRREHVRLGVVAAVSDPRGRILLTRRAAHMRSFPRAWVMPGGGLEEGESLTDCLVREVKEETGVDVDRGTVSPFCLWESCYPTCGMECLEAGSGITAHYLVVFCTARTTEKDLSKLQEQVGLDEQETDMAVWLSADNFILSLDYPLGGVDDIGSISSIVPSSSFSKESDAATCDDLNLDDLCGIYPRGTDMKGIAQGNLFMLQELLNSHRGAAFL
jgi:8-oxo-dGTP pyrophosphatase MutT (NUDIX family)